MPSRTSAYLRPQPLLDAAAQQAIAALPSGAEAAAVVALLRNALGLDATADEQIVRGYAENASGWPGRAQGLCRPRTELAAALRACRQAALPCTIAAGRSSLTGSASPDGGLLIATDKLSTPALAVDLGRRRARAPEGLVLERFREAVREQSADKLHYPVDPTSRNDCLLGGTLACNASGFRPGPAGATRPWVQALQVVLPDGRLVVAERGQYVSEDGVFRIADADGSLGARKGKCVDLVWPVPRYQRPRIKNAGGPWSSPDGRMDFVDLIVGSEGIFGVVVACELGLAEAPREQLDFFCSLPDETAALALKAALQRDGDRLAALEYFGPGAPDYMDHRARFFRGQDRVAIYLQVPLYAEDTETAAAEWYERLLGALPGLDERAVQLLDAVGRRAFLEARHAVPARTLEIVRRLGTHTIMTDTAVPAGTFADYLGEVHARIRESGIASLSFGHLADGHLHFMMLPTREQLARGEAVYDAIVAAAAARGGVYSGEHGTGKRKRRDFERCYGAAGIAAVQRAKAALDPDFVLNRGNVVLPPPAY